ncbi:hypothetical protein KUCAC02_021038 [Chaenocephalus aceratus]|uniref:Uncharacterized protein n=1 Tax=Chaenocephalus aceratus TaxID=36190 RepID=A0ACB9XGB2_CHAAC|nr:hypothetical protein KUCAC02_021038 [Chaenocephalus aceratus]
MKSVHSFKAAPYRRPVEQSQALNEGTIMVGLRHYTPPIENRRDWQKENTICLTLGEELSSNHLGYNVHSRAKCYR